MEGFPAGKSDRLLQICSWLVDGEILQKRKLAQYFGVTEKSIQRDIGALRCFFAEQALSQDVIYDPEVRGYHLINTMPQKLSNSEIWAVCKILLESRSMRKDEMPPVLNKRITCCVPEQNKAVVNQLIANEKIHYIEPHHGKSILDRHGDIEQAIQSHQATEIQYKRMKEPELVIRRVISTELRRNGLLEMDKSGRSSKKANKGYGVRYLQIPTERDEEFLGLRSY